MANYVDNSAINDQLDTDIGGINTRDLWRKLAAVHSRGNLAVNYRTITSSETLLPSDSIIIVDSTSNVTVTLPPANSWGSAKTPLITIIRRPGLLNGTVTVAANSSDAIFYQDDTSGVSSVVVGTTLQLISNGDLKWYILELNASSSTDNENLIIGGDFSTNPWQAGTTFAAIATTAYSADRWVTLYTTASVVTIQRSTNAPTKIQTGNYYTGNSVEALVTTADASIAAGDYFLFGQKIEGNRCKFLGFGQTSAIVCSLSFWVSSSKTGVHCVTFLNSASNRSYIAEYTVNSANTWEYKTISLPVDTSGTWLTDAATRGIQIYWTLACGSTFQTTANSWQALGAFATSSQVNCLDAVNNSFKLALVDFRRGLPPPVFQFRHPDIEKILCERYLQVYINRQGIRVTGYAAAAAQLVLQGYMYPTTMMTAPTSAIIGTWTNTNCANPAIGIAGANAFELFTTATAAGLVDSFPAANTGVLFQAEL